MPLNSVDNSSFYCNNMKIKKMLYVLMPFLMLALGACDVLPVQAPAVNLNKETLELGAGNEEGSVLLKPTRDWSATVEEGIDWLVIEPASGVASDIVIEAKISVLENVGAERSAEITFTAGNIEETLTVIQAGSGSQGGGDVEEDVITVAEFLSKPVGDGVYYRLKGTIDDLFDTTYGNFHLVDETGDVLVYGLTATKQSRNDQSFSTLGLEEGDVVIIEGTRDEFNGEAQVGGPAYYISHEDGQGGGGDEPGPGPEPGDLIEATIGEFLEADVDPDVWYKLTGTITNIESTLFGNFTVEDETGSVYVYGMTSEKQSTNDQSFSSLGLEVGDILTFATVRGEYNGEPQGGGNTAPAYYISHQDAGGDEPEPPQPGGSITVEEFLSKPVDANVYYRLTGEITDLYNTEYGNFHLVDETGSVLVYGLTATKQSSNDKSFSSLGLKAGDIVTIEGTRAEFEGEAQVGGPAYYISHEEGEGLFVGDVEVELGANAYYQDAVVNGTDYKVLKLGTSSKNGEASFTIPAGTTKMSFYCVAWNKETSSLKLSADCTITPSTISPAANSGAAGNPEPAYTMTVSDTDRYEFTVSGCNSDTVVNLESVEYRIILWDVRLD